MNEETIYHIYAKGTCLYPNLSEKEFKLRWMQLKAMVGLMKTDYTEKDLSYEKLPPFTGGVGNNNWKEPAGDDSY